MSKQDFSVAPPDLRILPVKQIHSHEEHDAQRAAPLIVRLRDATLFTNPPIVAPMPNGDYVVLDGANRHYSFKELGYPHILVQVVDYRSGQIDLGVWQHVLSNVDGNTLLEHIDELPHITLKQGWDHRSIGQILLRTGQVVALDAPTDSIQDRSASLREIVNLYQQQASVSRSALSDPMHIWELFPSATALVMFPEYAPEDIIEAAMQHAYLPPGVSRHIVQGRALKLNYPFEILRDTTTPLETKNAELQVWVQHKLSKREVRYYAESTYQFDE